MKAITCRFLDTLSAVQLLTRNANLYISYKVDIGRNRFDKRTMYNLQTIIYFLKKSRDHVDKTIDQLYLSKCISNVSF